ncbi:adenosylcobinamide-GDP ribazoletransferase [Terrarubrum flagellatum]|uniref:adenosylcobinamide-GDP ribazoletransferase n=1 Tax=Terrirubrum flagellatum TaxID=2895980 RepID=UPI003144F3C6
MDQPTDRPPPAANSATPTERRPGFVVSIAQTIRFYSRLPVPPLPGEGAPHAPPDIALLPRALPFAALIIAAPACAAIFISDWLGFPAFISAALTIAVAMLTTGAFHEDGLADVCDGFGGGATVPRKLEIMKDSRVGTYGASAICLSILLRTAALASLIETRPTLSVIALVLAIAALSRVAGLLPLAILPAARADGASRDVGRPDFFPLAIGFALASALTGVASALVDWPDFLGVALILVAIASGLAMTFIARRQIGGQTGDVAGAAQQIAEIACLLALLATGFAR